MARFDIVTPAYNAERFLATTLESVISQTFEDWRIILVDDGSTDSTPEIASLYQQRLGERLLLITQQNAGLPAARNAALRASTAEFIAILDADDIWLPCRLEESLRSFDRAEVGLSYGLVTRIDEHGRLMKTFTGNPEGASGRIARHIYRRTVELPCPTVSFRRSCIEAVGLFDETMRATEDRDLWFRIAVKYEVAAIPKVIAYYRTFPASMSGDIHRMLKAQLHFIRKHYGAPGCGPVSRQIAISRAYKQRAEGLKDRGKTKRGLLDALKACVIWPFGVDNLRTAASLFLSCWRIS